MTGLQEKLMVNGLFLPKYTSVIYHWKVIRMRNPFLQSVVTLVYFLESSFHGNCKECFMLGKRGHSTIHDGDLIFFPLLYILSSSLL